MGSVTAVGGSGAPKVDPAEAQRRAEEARQKAEAAAVEESKTPPCSQKDIDKVKPTKNELDSAFEGTSRKAELEKLLGLTPPPPQEVIQTVGSGAAPGVPFDAMKTLDAQAVAHGPFGQTSTGSSTDAWFHQRQGSNTGVVPSDAAPGNTVPIMPSPVTSKQ
ncbi:hypothetical protein [Myxococcus sp. AB056]|uniref:hypothetical protein n=1 Tax=Myxococcus sp. AB056 TaxID=2562792 RepID=UPI001E50ECEB|nr:hypothetical protein [Myxococcus sp. AB056]